ncbi:hypothetical protein GT360_15825 [Vibrio astriarenae]|uniref:Peptidase M15 n=1 Tax=Vibrio astriarenae TaxID=1481923 RepID=A0A7Z2YFD9_9VIBR|nr:hypothetical protein [Vibrio astriarenae]QIA65030.1 hypothetical protein GT360_15825 [Vibrio astriarenae]
MNDQITFWYQKRHLSYSGENQPSPESQTYLSQLDSDILTPIEQHFGPITITYGFTSNSLLNYIRKHSPGDMCPKIDQHAAMELNTRGNRICEREGAACDFVVHGFETEMHVIANYITSHLTFDRLYFYGKDRPLHISVGPEQSRYALIRNTRSDGLRVNGKSAVGDATRELFLEM